jgi:hypothetical protein
MSNTVQHNPAACNKQNKTGMKYCAWGSILLMG